MDQLPEPIIHNVLSFLSYRCGCKQTARKSVLSKAWWNAWLTRPILHFYEHEFKNKDDFMNYVNTTLLRYHEDKMSIEELELYGSFSDISELLFDGWLQIAAERNVKKLELVCNLGSHTWPSTILQAKSLEDLHLAVYDENSSSLEVTQALSFQKVSCYKLKRLSLSRVHLDGVMFNILISNCHLMEFLELHGCLGIENFEVTNLENLTELTIKGCCNLQRIKISSRALELLRLSIYQEQELMELGIEAPSMVWFSYYGTIIPRLSFSGGSRNRVSQVYIALDFEGLDASWLLKSQKFLTKFIPSDISLRLYCYIGKVLDNEEIRAGLEFLQPHLREYYISGTRLI